MLRRSAFHPRLRPATDPRNPASTQLTMQIQRLVRTLRISFHVGHEHLELHIPIYRCTETERFSFDVSLMSTFDVKPLAANDVASEELLHRWLPPWEGEESLPFDASTADEAEAIVVKRVRALAKRLGANDT